MDERPPGVPEVHDRRPGLLPFHGPSSLTGFVVGAVVGRLLAGRNGVAVGLGMVVGGVLGDLTDRILIARGSASAASLARAGRRIRSVAGVVGLGLTAVVLVALIATGEPVFVFLALCAGLFSGLLLWREGLPWRF
jgi:hypothetical protein